MKRLFTILTLLLLTQPLWASAATFIPAAEATDIRVGDTFTVTAFLDTNGEYVNAIEGELHFPAAVSLKAIRYDGSVVPLWVQAPTEVASGTVAFAGVLPGGYRASPTITKDGQGSIFTLVLEAKREGSYQTAFSSATNAYLDDGNGTKASVVRKSLTVVISPSSGAPRTADLKADTTGPEPFMLTKTAGEPFGVAGDVYLFSTQDKQSGVASYEAAQSYNKFAKESTLAWSAVASPYPQAQVDGKKYLFIRAVDGAHNTRIAVIPPAQFSVFALLYTWWELVILALGILAAGVIHFRRKKSSGR